MSLATDTRNIYMIFYATEILLLCIPEFQFKLVGIIYDTLQIYDTGRLLQTIKTRKLKVKE